MIPAIHTFTTPTDMTNQDVISASTTLYVDSGDAIEILQKIREANKNSWAKTAANVAEIDQSIRELAKAQAILRKMRERATTRISY